MTVANTARRTVIKTGSLALDEALGVGGLPCGRIIEIFGGASTGKTTLALAAAGCAQQCGGAVAYIDAEHKFDMAWGRANGLNGTQGLFLQGTSAQAVISSVFELTRSGRFALVVVDSLSALVPDEDHHDDFSQRDYRAEVDQLLAQALPRIAAGAARTNTCVLLLNQLRKNDAVFGRDKISAGGDIVDHFSSIRLELRRTTAHKDGEKVVGFGVKAVVLKNCVAPPFRAAELTINFERGLISGQNGWSGPSRKTIIGETKQSGF